MARYVRLSDERHGENSQFKDLNPEEQRLLLEWIRKYFYPRRSTTTRVVTAYGLKHMFGRSEFGFYVFSREMAEAMEKAGFQSDRTKWGDWRFNIAREDLGATSRNGKNRTLSPK